MMHYIDLKRRKFIEALAGAGLALITSPCACAAFPGVIDDKDTTNNADDFHPSPGTSQDRAPDTIAGALFPASTGCSLSLHSAANGESEQLSLSNTTGIIALDAGITNELQYLKRLFTVQPGFFMLHEGQHGNAFATREILGGHNFPHGTVVFGLTLMREEYAAAGQMGRFDHAMAAIMAHEWGHILQFRKLKSHPPGKAMELQADALAGWYMGVRSVQLRIYGSTVDIQTAMRSVFNKGDYAFNDPRHHGTPDERLKMFQMGLDAGYSMKSLSKTFTQSARMVGLI